MLPNAQIGCMLTKLKDYPATCAPADVLAYLNSNIINYFCADVQIRGSILN